MKSSILASFLVVLACIQLSLSFTVVPMNNVRKTTSLDMTIISYNGKKKDFKEGSPLKNAVSSLGVKVKYSCRKGDCATCQISLAGRMTKPCVAKVPKAPTLKSLQEKGLEIRN